MRLINSKKGMTLVEIIVVVALLAVVAIIVISSISSSGEKTKVKLLDAKLEGIENAAISYAQEHKEDFVDDTCSICNGITNCYCYFNLFFD